MHSNRQMRRPALPSFFLSWPLLYLGFALSASPFAGPNPPHSGEFSGTAALAYTRHAVSFGERPSGSQPIEQLRGWIIAQLKPLGGELSEDRFTAQTPAGPLPMVNLILKFPG